MAGVERLCGGWALTKEDIMDALTPEQLAAENEAWAWYIARRVAMAGLWIGDAPVVE